jgi:tryptophan-rich sensory protein
MDSLHPLIGLGTALIAASAGILVLVNAPPSWVAELAALRFAPPRWMLMVGVTVTAAALGVVIWRALGRGDNRTAILAAVALAANHLWLVLALALRSTRVAMAGLLVFAALVLAMVASANGGRATLVAAAVCAAWAVVNLSWTGRLTYSRTATDPSRRGAYQPRHA